METLITKNILFGDFEIDVAKRRLLKGAEIVGLNSKTFDLLLTLAENHGQILSKDELLDKVWAGQFVEENNLTVHISALRKIFGEKKGEPQFILTVPGKGYKFIADVQSNNFVQISHSQTANHTIALINTTTELETDELFLGRAQETADIKKLLRQNDISLVTLTGAGGTGKTKLAQVVARQLKTDFPDGVFFIELVTATETEYVISAIAQTLNVVESNDKSLLESIKDFLREQQILLVLDNFEQVMSAVPLVRELLVTVSLLKILVTSRAPLHLGIEHEFFVKPLDLPPTDAEFSLEKLAEYPSILLFCKRAQSVKPIFLLSNENISAVTEICRRLDGLPLAIELAAARISLLSPQAILDRLENSLNLLTGGAKDSPARQRTMRETIQWSYDLLSEDEQFLFRRLAVFAGGFTVEAAEALGEREKGRKGEGEKAKAALSRSTLHAPLSTLDLLDSLIENNLLVSKEQTDGNVRLQMLEVVREFALEVLQKTGEIDELQQFHAQYFLALAEEADPFLQSETGNEWLEKLETEHDNFRVALGWSLKNDGETGARIVAALRYFWLSRGHLSEGFQWSNGALQVTENTVSDVRFKLLMGNGIFLRHQGNLEKARKVYEKALVESKEINDLSQIIKTNHGLAAIAVLQKDFAAAQIFYEEALALSRELKDEMQIAYTLGSLGDLELSRGNPSSARHWLEECLALSKKLGNKRLLTIIYFNLGTADYLENKPDGAAFNFAESLRIAQEMGSKAMISCSFDGFAALATQNGNAEQSTKLAGLAETLRESIGYKIEVAEENFRENYLTKTRALLDEKNFADFFEQGKQMDLEQTISALLKPQLILKTPKVISNSEDEMTEIIIESHSFSRVTIEESLELENGHFAEPKLITSSKKNQFGWLKQNRLAVAGLCVIVALLGVSAWFWQSKQTIIPFQKVSFRRLTNNGKITNAAITHDGNYAVFSQVEKDGESLWLKHIATGSQNQILKPQSVNFVGLTVSPDNNFIYATAFSGDFPDPQIWRIPILGGSTEHIQDLSTGATISISPDGKRMAFTESHSSVKATMFGIADINGDNKKFLIEAKDEQRSFPNFKTSPVAWSEDGKEIACIVEEKNSDGKIKATVLLIAPNDGSEKLLTQKRWDHIHQISWVDAENIALSATSMNQEQLWIVSRQTGESRQITNDLNSYSWVSSANNNILTVQKNVVSKVSVGDYDESAKKIESRHIFEESGNISNIHWTNDGKILYSSTASGQPEIWRSNPDGSDKTQLTVNSGVSFGISVSPTDKSLLFGSNQDGRNFLRLADSEGKNIRPLIDGSEEVWGNFTPDGQSVIFQNGLNNKTLTLWRFDLKDKKLTQLTKKNALQPTISPDGTQIAFYFMDSEVDNLWRIGIISALTGESLGKIDLPKEATERRMRWHPNGKFISQIAYQGENIKLLLLPISKNNSPESFDLGKGKLEWFEWSKDGKKIVVSQSTETQDIVLINQ